MAKKEFTLDEAKQIGNQIGITWQEFDVDQFQRGLNVELEHGSHDQRTNVTDDNPIMTGKIAWAHLIEFPDYYDRLEKIEKEAETFWAQKSNNV